MEAVEHSILVNVPAAVAYERWLDAESFPRFIPGLKEVRRTGENQFAWVWESHGHRLESVAEVTLQIPGRRIAWRSVSGRESSSVMAFEETEPGVTCVTLSMKYLPAGEWDNVETVGARLRGTLEGFKTALEGSMIGEIVEKNWQGF